MINDDDSLQNNKRFVRAIARLEFILGRVGGGLIALGDGLFRLRFFLLFLDDVELGLVHEFGVLRDAHVALEQVEDASGVLAGLVKGETGF